jgi:hypothetical protein
MSPEEKYRRQLTRMWLRRRASMESAFIRVAKEFSQKFGNSPIIRNNEGFIFKSHVRLNREFTAMMGRFETTLYKNVTGGIKDAWELGNQLNDEYVEYYFKDLKGFTAIKDKMMARNFKALDAFINRKRNSRTLSNRVWKTSNRFRNELEANLLIGIADGKSASDIAIDIQRYLNNPDTVFRRVRDTEGKLQLSNAAKLLQPGPGVYRSSYKNAFRLTRTEINSSYRMADHLRWQKEDFILGFDVKLSAQHPRYDICDELQGRYPKDFLFEGWHPQCFCHAEPVRMEKKDFIDKLNGKDIDVHPVSDLPGDFKKWVSDNRKRIGRMRNKPTWITDNWEIIKKSESFHKRKPQKKSESFSP